ncbi:GM10905 [Drosophila sechellia]|uniref:GM10905 n=1 Tax=Drosophila sechellia TaxID=7238 RepID=B4I4I3_DROSE|nr:GM10905 [Drosophila sechellia]
MSDVVSQKPEVMETETATAQLGECNCVIIKIKALERGQDFRLDCKEDTKTNLEYNEAGGGSSQQGQIKYKSANHWPRIMN